MATREINLGAQFSEEQQLQGIAAYVDGGDWDSEQQRGAVIHALYDAFHDEVVERLPDEVLWIPGPGVFLAHIEDEALVPDADAMGELFGAAWEAAEARADEIVARATPMARESAFYKVDGNA